MEEEAKQNDRNQLVFSSLKVRTMQDDLKNVQAPAYLPLTPTSSPAQKQPEKKEFQKPAKEKKPSLDIESILNQARQTFEKKQYEETINLAEKIIQEKSTSWLLGFKAKRLLNQAKKEVEKQDKLTKEKIRKPQKIVSKILPEPPQYLPTQPPPQPPKTVLPATAPAPPVIKPLPPPAPPQVPRKQASQPQPVKPVQPTSIPQPKVSYKQQKVIYGQPLKTKPASKRHLRIGLIFGIPATILILGIFGFIYYYYFLNAPKPLCQEGQINSDCRCGEETKNTGFCCNSLWTDYDCSLTKVSVPLIQSIDQILTIDAQSANSDKIISDLKQTGQENFTETAKIIALKLQDSPPKYATLNDLISIFGISLPDNLKTNTEAFNLLLYAKPQNFSETDPAQETRLVLVLKQKDGSLAEQIMSGWEATMLQDMRPIILGQPSASATAGFISTTYNNGFFRYKNLPTKTATINYTIYQNLVILGTSKSSIFYVYDSTNRNFNAANP